MSKTYYVIQFTDPRVLSVDKTPRYAVMVYASTLNDPEPEAKAIPVFTGKEEAERCIRGSGISVGMSPVLMERKRVWMSWFCKSTSRFCMMRAGKKVDGLENMTSLPVIVNPSNLIEYKGDMTYDSFTKFLRKEMPMCLRSTNEFQNIRKAGEYTVATVYDNSVKRYCCMAVKGDFQTAFQMIDRIEEILDTTEEREGVFSTLLFKEKADAEASICKLIWIRGNPK